MPWGDKDNKGSSGQSPWGRPTGGGGNSGGGRGPSGGDMPPGPDFNDLFRKSQEQWNKWFPGDGNESAKGFALIAAVGVLLWLSSGIYFVKADEQGVVLRFGQYTRTTASGVNYHFPYPFESVLTPRVTSVNQVEVGFRSSGASRSTKSADSSIAEESLMLTGDENIVDIDFEVQWKISNAPDYLFNIRNPEESVKAISESAMREVIGKSKIAAVFAEGKLLVEQDTRKLIQETLDGYKAGIEVVSVNLLKADPPTQVIDAFRDVQTARADLETSRNQAEAYSNDILPKARGQAQQMILEAEAYKQEVIARSQGEASRFNAVYNEFKQARDVTKKRMYLEAMEDILQGVNKVIVDGKSASGVVPYLPLPALKAHNEEAAK
jgi:modulator of FtsH protease HflK